jgi:hypothetical protein
VDGEREVGQMTGEKGGGRWRTGGKGEDDSDSDTTGRGPTLIFHHSGPPPPPALKVERQGGSGIA